MTSASHHDNIDVNPASSVHSRASYDADREPEEGRLRVTLDQATDDGHDHDPEKPALHAPPKLSTLRSVGLIATCTTAMILNSSNNTAIAIALPTIGDDLGIPEYRLQWVISAYSLGSGCLLLFFGRLADLYGRKKAFLSGIFVLGVFGLGCGFTHDEITLDVLRGFQGLGAAACIPASLGILAHSFPPSRLRSIAFATFAAGAPVGAAIGSAIGGVLTQLTDKTWRSTFWFLTGISALTFVGGALSFDKDQPSSETDRRIDWLGAFLVTSGLVLLVFALSDGSVAPNEWNTPYIIATLILGPLLLLAYVAWEHFLERQVDAGSTSRWTPPPVMRVSLWTRAHGKLAVTFVIAMLEYSSFMSFTFWIQLYYQDYEHLNPVLTMVRILPMFVTGVLCNIIVALFVGHVPLVYLVAFGTTLTGVANILFAVINPASPYWAFGFPAAIVSVFGADFVFASGTLFVAKVCLPHEQSVGGAMFQTMTQLGAAFGLAITTIVYDSELKKASLADGVVVNVDGTNAPRRAQLVAYKDAFWAAFALGIFGTLLSLVFLRGAGIVGHRKGMDGRSTTSGETVRDEKAQRDMEEKDEVES
ncbi:efflux transporter [Laetiporus sulphureus 93-53]|uniref:Efflux transporter n=1 Tax=Laetiporus sulphureus 93-53 TaxID=1314785 RepID=A0A165E1Z2_9APHY|nr:efflux transporter [Laetiporus sulphureus 93-53]KZT06091.1 efflux transporter [Laetiporus sulphureus 93-53]